MPAAFHVAIVLVVSYLLGAIPFSVIVSRLFYHMDVREYGSGNAGATNVMRVLGVKAALVVLALDMLKGALAACLALWWPVAQFGATAQEWVLIGAALAAVLGHTYSPYLGFQGGKGVATAAGAMLAVAPLAFGILLAIFIVVVASSRMVSLGSIAIALAFPPVVFLCYPTHHALLSFSFAAVALVIWRHRGNLARIARREEAKISFTRPGKPTRPSD